jgi:GAF domain-containing protein
MLKRRNAPKVVRPHSSSATGQETEVAQLARERDEALEQLSGASEVLKVIGSSSGDLKPVFQTMLAKAVGLCQAKFGVLWLREGDRFRSVALHNVPVSQRQAREREPLVQFGPHSGSGRAIRTKRAVHIPDLMNDEGYLKRDTRLIALVETGGARAAVFTPLLKDNEVIGILVVFRQEVGPFTDKQMALVENFAAQAVIAIENTRLLNELRQRTTDLTDSLEQQTATSEVLKVISGSPTEIQPVLDAVVANAGRLCQARTSTVFLREGDMVVPSAHFGPLAAAPIGQGQPINRDWVTGRAVLEARATQVTDLLNSDEYPYGRELARRFGHRATLAVPLLREGVATGAILVRRSEPRPFTDKQIELVQNFAAQAVIAIENTRLLNELRESLEQQTATAEVLSVISRSPGELEPVFEAMLQNSVRICEAGFGQMFLCEGDNVRLVATVGVPTALVEFDKRRGTFQPLPGGGLDQVIRTKQVAHIADLT